MVKISYAVGSEDVYYAQEYIKMAPDFTWCRENHTPYWSLPIVTIPQAISEPREAHTGPGHI